jgi:hypothetical protein
MVSYYAKQRLGDFSAQGWALHRPPRAVRSPPPRTAAPRPPPALGSNIRFSPERGGAENKYNLWIIGIWFLFLEAPSPGRQSNITLPGATPPGAAAQALVCCPPAPFIGLRKQDCPAATRRPSAAASAPLASNPSPPVPAVAAQSVGRCRSSPASARTARGWSRLSYSHSSSSRRSWSRGRRCH